jgi:hypothetical protein
VVFCVSVSFVRCVTAIGLCVFVLCVTARSLFVFVCVCYVRAMGL